MDRVWKLPQKKIVEDDYRRGGLQVLPVVHGPRIARVHLFAYTIPLVLVSLALRTWRASLR